MKKQVIAEVHVLNRILYLLEERSVGNLVDDDKNFAKFVGQVYETVKYKADQLLQANI